MEKLSIDEFAKKVKEKYPEYNHLSNKDLAEKVLEKYPEYWDIVEERGALEAGAAKTWAGLKAVGAGVEKGARDVYAMGVTKPAGKLAGLFGDEEDKERYEERAYKLGQAAQKRFRESQEETSEEIGEFATTGLGILGGVAPAIAGTLLTKDPRALIALGSTISGVQAGGAKQAELAEKEFKKIRKEDPSISEYDARVKAINRVSGQAMLQGAKTAGITATGGIVASKLGLAGIETGLRSRSVISSASQSGRLGADARTLAEVSNMRRLFNTSGLEGLEEGVDSAIESGLDWSRGFEPDLTLKEATDRAAESFGWGVALGGLLGQVDKTTRFEKLGGETEAQRVERVKAERYEVLKRDIDEVGRETAERIIRKVKPKLDQSALDWAKAQNPTIDDVGVPQERSDNQIRSMKLAEIEKQRLIKELEQPIEEAGVGTQLQVAEEKAIRQAKEAELEAIKSGTRIEGESVGAFKPQQVFEPAIEEAFKRLGVDNLEDAVKVLSGEMPARPKREFKRTPDEVMAPQAPPIEAPVESFLDPSSIAAQENAGLPLPDHTLPHRISQLVAAMRSLRNKKDPKSMERLLVMDKQLEALRKLSVGQFGPRRGAGKAIAQADQPLNVRDLQAARRDLDKASTVIGPTFTEKLKTERQAKIARGVAGAETATTAAMASPDVLAPEAPRAAEIPNTFSAKTFGLTPVQPVAPSKAANLGRILTGQVQPPTAPAAPVESSKAADAGKILEGPKARSLTLEERRLVSASMSGKGFEQSAEQKIVVQKGLNKIAEALELAKGRVETYPKKPEVYAGVELRQSGVTPQQLLQGAIETGILAIKAGVVAADIADIAISNLVANAKSGGIKITEHEKKQVLDKIGDFVGQTSSIPTTEIAAARAELKDMGYRKLNIDPEMADIDVESDVAINPLEVFAESELSNREASEGEKRILTRARAAAKRIGLNKEGVQLDPQMATETDLAMQTVYDSIMLDRNTFDDALDVAWNSLTPVQKQMLDKSEFKAELAVKMDIVLSAVIEGNLTPRDAMSNMVSSGRPKSLEDSAAILKGEIPAKALSEGVDWDIAGQGPDFMGKWLARLADNAPDEAIRRGYTLLGNKIAEQWVRNMRLAGRYESLVYEELLRQTGENKVTPDMDNEQALYRKAREDARRAGKEDPSMDNLSPEAAMLVRGIDAAFDQQGQDAKAAKVKQRGKDGKWVVGEFGMGKGGAYQILKKEYRDLIPILHADSLTSGKLTAQQEADTRAFIEGIGGKKISDLISWIDDSYSADGDSTKTSNANSGLEKRRQNPISTELIDFGIDSFDAQSRSWAKRLSEIEAYGQGVDGKADLFKRYIDLIGFAASPKMKGRRTKLSQEDIDREVEFIEDLRQHIFEIEQGKRDVPSWVKGLGKGVSYSLLSGISSSINNVGAIGQIAASGMAMGRKRAFLKVAARLILPSKLASIIGAGENLELQTLNSMGVLGKSLDAIAGGYQTESETGLATAVSRLDEGEGAWARKSEKLGKAITKPFSWTERGVRNLSAQMADAYLKDVQQAYKTNTDPKLIKAFKAYAKSLKGVDADAALEGNIEAEADFIVRVVSENVGSFKVQQMPRWMTRTTGRFFSKFMPYMMFMTQSTGRMLTLMQKEKGLAGTMGMLVYIAASHVLTQESLAKLKEIIFGKERNVASLDEILNSPIDRGIIKAGDRIVQDLSGAGALGVAGYLMDQIRYNDGLPTAMDTANMSIFSNLLKVGANPYTEGIPAKLEEFLEKQLSAYRDTKNIFENWTDFERSKLRAAELKRLKMRRTIERYGKDEGIDTDRPSGVPTEMHQYYRELRDDLYIGSVLEARRAALKAADNMEDRDRAWSNVSSAILGGQPMKIGRRYSDDAQQKFMVWARRTLSPDDYRDIMDAHTTYKSTALEAGLITGTEVEAERYEETRNQMKEAMNQKPAKKKKRGGSYSPIIGHRERSLRGSRSGVFAR